MSIELQIFSAFTMLTLFLTFKSINSLRISRKFLAAKELVLAHKYNSKFAMWSCFGITCWFFLIFASGSI
ncbi:hypothetical protein [Pantoea agglomerans]|uniref:hypothetical protein n=1 Tax=Enterobacter agglomerans TaxID=549 RepID=UPI000DFD11DF|nr:hypothetical protein [Pantoea agglomerans]SUC48994.1 Uncharacterised protein [Pantoea agglomerans]